MEREDAVMFLCIISALILGLILTILKEKRYEKKVNKHPYLRVNQEKDALNGSTKIPKAKPQDKSKPKSAKKKKRKPKLKKNEQGLVGRPPKSPRKRNGGSKKVPNNF